MAFASVIRPAKIRFPSKTTNGSLDMLALKPCAWRRSWVVSNSKIYFTSFSFSRSLMALMIVSLAVLSLLLHLPIILKVPISIVFPSIIPSIYSICAATIQGYLDLLMKTISRHPFLKPTPCASTLIFFKNPHLHLHP